MFAADMESSGWDSPESHGEQDEEHSHIRERHVQGVGQRSTARCQHPALVTLRGSFYAT
jgi:hypothetical protein